MINLQTTTAFAGLALVTVFAAVVATKVLDGPPRCTIQPEDVPIAFLSSDDFDCISRSQCRAEAHNAYLLAMDFKEHTGADIANRYLAYKHFTRAEGLLKRGWVSVPDNMLELSTHKAGLEAELEQQFREARIDYHQFSQRHNYMSMAEELQELKVYFPDRGARYHVWATEREREMKSKGIYPRRHMAF